MSFVDSDETTSLGGGDVISTYPDQEMGSIPTPTAPDGMTFEGWKVWLGDEPMYEGDFTFAALEALREELDGPITWVNGEETWITFKAVYAEKPTEPEEPTEPEPEPENYQLYSFEKELVDDWRDAPSWESHYDISYPYRGTVDVDEGDNVTLLYTLTVTGDEGARYTITDADATIYDEDGSVYGETVSGVLGENGETVYYAVKTFFWREIKDAYRDGDGLTNNALIAAGEDTVGPDDGSTAEETVDVVIDWDDDDDRPGRPDRPDDDKDDEDDQKDEDEESEEVEETEEGVTGLNTTDHYAYITGYEDGTVRPEGNITRAEVATIFFRLMTDEFRTARWSTVSGYTDVSAANWYNNAVSTTSNAGWVSGYPDGTFRPDAYITRAEFATIAARFLSDVYAGGHRFNDIQGHWAAEYIDRAAAAGWIGGYEDGSFRPNAYITRAEVATLVNRMLDRAPDVSHLLADMVRWPDNPETAWYYADIQEATNSHDYTRAGTGNYEVWTELLANRDWAALEEIWSQANDAPGGEVMG